MGCEGECTASGSIFLPKFEESELVDTSVHSSVSLVVASALNIPVMKKTFIHRK